MKLIHKAVDWLSGY